MSGAADAVKVSILEKEYLVACKDGEKEALLASAKYLSEKMADIRSSGKVVGIDRIAVMAALNLAHEVVNPDARSNRELFASYETRLHELNTRVEQALDNYKETELN